MIKVSGDVFPLFSFETPSDMYGAECFVLFTLFFLVGPWEDFFTELERFASVISFFKLLMLLILYSFEKIYEIL